MVQEFPVLEKMRVILVVQKLAAAQPWTRQVHCIVERTVINIYQTYYYIHKPSTVCECNFVNISYENNCLVPTSFCVCTRGL